MQIQYDLPPESLTRGQVSRTYCYDNGKRVAGLREPLTGGYRWTTHEFTTTYDPCQDPRDVPEDTPGPRSSNEAHRAWQEAYRASQSSIPQTITAPWITASTWTVSGTKFSVSADVGEIIRRNGDGVYSVMVWATVGGEHLLISQYSIFHGITPPRTYDPDWQELEPGPEQDTLPCHDRRNRHPWRKPCNSIRTCILGTTAGRLSSFIARFSAASLCFCLRLRTVQRICRPCRTTRRAGSCTFRCKLAIRC